MLLVTLSLGCEIRRIVKTLQEGIDSLYIPLYNVFCCLAFWLLPCPYQETSTGPVVTPDIAKAPFVL